jgi:hypothetical protein
MDGCMHGRTENIYSIFRDKLLLLGEHVFIHYMNSYFIQIHIMNLFPCLLCSLYTHVIALYSNSSNTLIKLAKGSKLRITSFENSTHRQLQTPSFSSKLSVRDDIVSECLYICNQNFDQRVHFNCAAVSDENWMLWNFYDKERDYMDISNQVPKFHDVHHVWVKLFFKQQFLKCDCLL